MPKPWTLTEKEQFHSDLRRLYIVDNLSIREVGERLGLAEQTIYKRLIRLGIPIQRHLKKGFNNTTRRVTLPSVYTPLVAEFFGVMLGDGHINQTQVTVTLGTKEEEYVLYVVSLIRQIFTTEASVFLKKSIISDSKYRMVYFGSVRAVRWLVSEGLVYNKVKSQVDVPKWIFSRPEFIKAFLRGFFDTDGSVYALRFGIQISLTNHSVPILHSLHAMLTTLGYSPSAISGYRLYLTKRNEVKHFFSDVKPANPKHQRRFAEFQKRVGTQAVNEGRL